MVLDKETLDALTGLLMAVGGGAVALMLTISIWRAIKKGGGARGEFFGNKFEIDPNRSNELMGIKLEQNSEHYKISRRTKVALENMTEDYQMLFQNIFHPVLPGNRQLVWLLGLLVLTALNRRIRNNNFLDEFQGERAKRYFDNILLDIRGFWGNAVADLQSPPAFDLVEPAVRGLIGRWLCDVSKICANDCQNKIENYRDYGMKAKLLGDEAYGTFCEGKAKEKESDQQIFSVCSW